MLWPLLTWELITFIEHTRPKLCFYFSLFCRTYFGGRGEGVWETYFMAQLMSTSTASSASTRLRAEACDKGHDPAQLPLPKVVTLMCNLVCAVWFWQYDSAQGPPCAKRRNLYQAHFCLQEFRNNNVSLKKWRVLETICSLSVFTFCSADTSGFYQNLSVLQSRV